MPVRIFKSLLFYPDLFLQLPLHIAADFFHRRAPVNLFPVFYYLYLKILKGAVLEASLLPVFLRVNITDRFGRIDFLVIAGKVVGNGFALLIINTVDLLQARVRNLLRGFGYFNFGDKLAAFFDCREFIHRTEDRIGSGSISRSPTPKLSISAP